MTKRGIVKKVVTFIVIELIILEVVLRTLGFSYKMLNYSPQQLDRDKFRIFCLGESTTSGMAVTKGMNYPGQLEKLLNANVAVDKYQVIYDMSIGSNSSKMLLHLPDYIRTYQPNLIIAMIGVNNWCDLDQSNILLYSKDNTISKITYSILIFMHKFRVFKLAKLLYYKYIYNEEVIDWVPYDDANIPSHLRTLYDEILRHDLSEIVRICKTNNIKIVIASYPLDDCRQVHIDIAREFGIPFVNNYSAFEEIDKRGDLSDYLIYDNWHPNEKGYAIIAQNIYDVLNDNKLLLEDT